MCEPETTTAPSSLTLPPRLENRSGMTASGAPSGSLTRTTWRAAPAEGYRTASESGDQNGRFAATSAPGTGTARSESSRRMYSPLLLDPVLQKTTVEPSGEIKGAEVPLPISGSGVADVGAIDRTRGAPPRGGDT
jgi:hypothetical protein